MNPFIVIDEFDRLTGQTTLATIFEQYFVKGTNIPGDIHRNIVFSAEYIFVITP